MAEEYVIDSRRHVTVKQENGEFNITIEEPGSIAKCVTLPARRWAALLAYESEIDGSVHRLQAKQNVHYKSHLGGGYFVSVTTGFLCVDIREFYYSKAQGEPRPTRHGIAMNLKQWSQLKEVALLIAKRFPQLTKTELCSHQILAELMNCVECHPYKEEFDQLLSIPFCGENIC
jgi:hypothetical protein